MRAAGVGGDDEADTDDVCAEVGGVEVSSQTIFARRRTLASLVAFLDFRNGRLNDGTDPRVGACAETRVADVYEIRRCLLAQRRGFELQSARSRRPDVRFLLRLCEQAQEIAGAQGDCTGEQQ